MTSTPYFDFFSPAKLAGIFLCWVFLALLQTSELQSGEISQPNVIVIFTDDHGYTDLSCQEIRQDIRTPNIDSLATGGIRMASGYVTAPQCVPSRAGLISGKYQNRFGVESNGVALDGFNLQQTLARRLKQAGYATGMTGKWHLGEPDEIVNHGFDDVYYKNSNQPGWSNFSLDGEDRIPGKEDAQGYHLDICSDAACAFIRRHKDQPFFFYCAYRAPHVPLDAPKKYLDRFPGPMPERRRQCLAMMSAVDDGVGKILATLRQYQLEENTLIFFMGDNGAPLKIYKLDEPGSGAGWDGSLNDPLNGEKGMLSEGGIRVPFAVYWKGKFASGQTYDHPVISLDVAATACALAGLPDDPTLDGVNLVPFLTGENKSPPHETLYWRWIAQSAVREGKWKYLRGGKREYLFDLESDKEEKHNLISSEPEIADRLRSKLVAWSEELQPPGVETKAMSTTWEDYYDFYLDGKPAPKQRAKFLPEAPATENQNDQALQGWTLRNGSVVAKVGRIEIQSNSGAKQGSFLANSKLEIPKGSVATIRMRSAVAGQAGMSCASRGKKILQPVRWFTLIATRKCRTTSSICPRRTRSFTFDCCFRREGQKLSPSNFRMPQEQV